MQDTESFYKLIAENKDDRRITPSKRKSKSIHNTNIFPGESLLLKTPLSLLYNEPRNHEIVQCILANKNLLHSSDCLTLI